MHRYCAKKIEELHTRFLADPEFMYITSLEFYEELRLAIGDVMAFLEDTVDLYRIYNPHTKPLNSKECSGCANSTD